MNLTQSQRIIISNALQDVLGGAQVQFEQYLREQNIPCETQEQMENYLKFGRHYFLRLRDKAPRSEDLITYEHK